MTMKSAINQICDALHRLVEEHGAPNNFTTGDVLCYCPGLKTARQVQAPSRGATYYVRPEPGKVAAVTYSHGEFACGPLEDEPLNEPHTTPRACFDCEEQGFIVAYGRSGVERCDACKVFGSDEAALAAALGLAARCFTDPSLPRKGVRFDKLVAALGVAEERLHGEDPEALDDDVEDGIR